MVYLKNENLRPKAIYPTYPPYHKGDYLEEYFFNWWSANKVETRRNYIDVYWTNIYCNAAHTRSGRINIQAEIADRAVELLAIPEGKSAYILDIGCGSGLSGQVQIYRSLSTIIHIQFTRQNYYSKQ